MECHHHARHPGAIAPRPSPMTHPLSVAVAGLGTVGAGVLKLLRDNADIVAARAGRPIAVTAVSARDRTRDRGVSLSGLRWYEDPVALAADPAVDVVVELIGGSDGPARALVQAALAAGKPVVTANKAMLAVHGAVARRRGRGARRAAGVRGGGGRRHPGDQGAARGPRRQPHPAHRRHPERHLQLHPDPDARARPRVRRGARRCAEAGLRRGRSVVRHRRHRRRAQAGDPGRTRVRPAGRVRRRACRGHPQRLRARHRVRRRARLPHQAARHRAADRRRDRGARASLHGAAIRADRARGRRVQRGGGGGRLRRPRHAGGPRRRRRTDRVRRGRRPDRHRAQPLSPRCGARPRRSCRTRRRCR